MGFYSIWFKFSSLREKPSFQPWYPSDRWNTWYNLSLFWIWLKAKWLLPRITSLQQLPDSVAVLQHTSPSCSCCYSALSSGCCTLWNTKISEFLSLPLLLWGISLCWTQHHCHWVGNYCLLHYCSSIFNSGTPDKQPALMNSWLTACLCCFPTTDSICSALQSCPVPVLL